MVLAPLQLDPIPIMRGGKSVEKEEEEEEDDEV
jgi:hypothetical protein